MFNITCADKNGINHQRWKRVNKLVVSNYTGRSYPPLVSLRMTVDGQQDDIEIFLSDYDRFAIIEEAEEVSSEGKHKAFELLKAAEENWNRLNMAAFADYDQHYAKINEDNGWEDEDEDDGFESEYDAKADRAHDRMKGIKEVLEALGLMDEYDLYKRKAEAAKLEATDQRKE